MGDFKVNFLNKEYLLPKDILVYFDLFELANNIKESVMVAFTQKLLNEESGCIEDVDLINEINEQTGRFISLLCKNKIFNRTVSDYLNDNQGYLMFSNVNKEAAEMAKSRIIRQANEMTSGIESAAKKAESSITGLGYTIYTSSMIELMLHEWSDDRKRNKQTKVATEQYQKEMNLLCSSLDYKYDVDRKKYINEVYIPNMEKALTIFAYELLGRYITDLINNGIFDENTLKYTDLVRSNEILQNLKFANDVEAVIENAFLSCPFNIDLYFALVEFNLLDENAIKVSKLFKIDKKLVSLFEKNLGKVSYPEKFEINYKYVELLSAMLNKKEELILRDYTNNYVNSIIKMYTKIEKLSHTSSFLYHEIRIMSNDDFLAGEKTSRNKAKEYVNKIVDDCIWQELIDCCGHCDLIDKINSSLITKTKFANKVEIDTYLIEKLYNEIEIIRNKIENEIWEEQAEIEKNFEQELENIKYEVIRKKEVKGGLIAVGIIVVAILVAKFLDLI